MKKTETQTRSAASRKLHAMDSAAEFVVTTGGFIVLAAVLGICLYLFWVVLPLFEPGEVLNEERARAETTLVGSWVMADPYSHAATVISPELETQTYLLSSGIVVGGQRFADEQLGEVTASSFARGGRYVAIGYAGGQVQLGSLGYGNELVAPPDQTGADAVAPVESGYVQRLEDGRGRLVRFGGEFGDPIELAEGQGLIEKLDYQTDPTGKEILAAMREDGTVLVNSVRTIRPLGGGKPTVRLSTRSFVLDPNDRDPDWFMITTDAEHVLLVWKDGRLQRYARAGGGEFGLRETMQLTPEGVEISTATMLLGGQTLLAGREDGWLESFHITDDLRDQFGDARRLVRSHSFLSAASPIVAITPSTRDRSVVILHEDGRLRVRHLTSEKQIAGVDAEIDDAIAVTMSPKNNGVLVLGDGGDYVFHEIEPGYPEFSMKALFGRVHYEGVDEPQYVYQSSSGDDASEIKLSLMPLIFGTLKATVFAMLFAVPIAVLAAIYSSEFISKRVRRKVKPTVELMASLPSVVLGFIAAMVVAPYVAEFLDAVMIGLIVVPLAVLTAAHVWQLIPLSLRLRTRTGQHLMLVALSLFVGAGVSTLIGPPLVNSFFEPDRFDAAMMAGAYERVPSEDLPEWAQDAVFETRLERRLRNLDMGVVNGEVVRPVGDEAHSQVLAELGLETGNLRRWLNDEYGQARPGWLLVFFPLALLLAWVAQALLIRRRLDLWIAGKESYVAGLVVLIKFLALSVAGFLLAYLAASVAQWLGFDPRDSIFGPFSPRNTLVVAIIMGFAVIPIIFTISEDSLQAVPMTLRTASLGSGATTWQTATRVVLPVAASGIFSACMIGFGRAVGETMIVLMATGNTPQMDWNIFSGFRTLAANIAVELPEAPKGETHYRVLFLCGLVLFLMTFVINTLAELVRRVVRARNAGL